MFLFPRWAMLVPWRVSKRKHPTSPEKNLGSISSISKVRFISKFVFSSTNSWFKVLELFGWFSTRKRCEKKVWKADSLQGFWGGCHSFLSKQLGIFLRVMFSDSRFYVVFIVNSARHWQKPRPKKSTLVFSRWRFFRRHCLSMLWKDAHDFWMDIMWISWMFFVWKPLFWLEIVENLPFFHGSRWEVVSNPFLGNMSSFFA